MKGGDGDNKSSHHFEEPLSKRDQEACNPVHYIGALEPQNVSLHHLFLHSEVEAGVLCQAGSASF